MPNALTHHSHPASGGIPAPHSWGSQPDALWVCWLSPHSDAALAPEVVLLPSREVSLEGLALSEWLGARLVERDPKLDGSDPAELAAAWLSSSVASGLLCGAQYLEPCLPGDRPLALLHARARAALGARATHRHTLTRALFLRVVRVRCPESLSGALTGVLMSDATLHVSARTPVALRAARAHVDALLGAPARNITWSVHQRDGVTLDAAADVLWRVNTPVLGDSALLDLLSAPRELWEQGEYGAAWGDWCGQWAPAFADEAPATTTAPAPRDERAERDALPSVTLSDALHSSSPLDSHGSVRDSLYMMNYEDAPSEHEREPRALSLEIEAVLADLSLTTTGESINAESFEAELSFLPSAARPEPLPTLDAEVPDHLPADLPSPHALAEEVAPEPVPEPAPEPPRLLTPRHAPPPDLSALSSVDEELIDGETLSSVPRDLPLQRFEEEEHSVIIDLSFSEMKTGTLERDEGPRDLDPRLEEQLKRSGPLMIPSSSLDSSSVFPEGGRGSFDSSSPSESSVMMGRPLTSSMDQRLSPPERDDEGGPMTFNEYRHSRDTVSAFVPTEDAPDPDLEDLGEVSAPTRLDLDFSSIESALLGASSVEEDAPTSAEMSRGDQSLSGETTKVDPDSFLEPARGAPRALPSSEAQIRSEAPTLARAQSSSTPIPAPPSARGGAPYGARPVETVVRHAEAPPRLKPPATHIAPWGSAAPPQAPPPAPYGEPTSKMSAQDFNALHEEHTRVAGESQGRPPQPASAPPGAVGPEQGEPFPKRRSFSDVMRSLKR